MKKEHINNTNHSDKGEASKVRLAQSKSKRTTYHKITIYSNKYAHSSPTPAQHPTSSRNININSVQLISSKPEISYSHQQPQVQDAKSHSSYHNKVPGKPPTIVSIEEKGEKVLSQQLWGYLTEQMEGMRAKYEEKMSILLQQNAVYKCIFGLKNRLSRQQERMQELQGIISKLMGQGTPTTHNTKHTIQISYRPNTTTTNHHNTTNHPNHPNHYYRDKTKDLETTLRKVMEAFISGQLQLNSKIERLQNDLIRHQTLKIGRCWSRIEAFCKQAAFNFKDIQEKLRQRIARHTNESASSHFCILRKRLQQVQIDVLRMRQSIKRGNVDHPRLADLLNTLSIKVTQLQRHQANRSRRVVKEYLEDDDDQFFYPPTERKIYHTNDQRKNYHTNDEYEHFQSQVEEELNNNRQENYNINFDDSIRFYARLQKLKNH